jgi:hypothetical protein
VTALGEWDDSPGEPAAEPTEPATGDGLMYPNLGEFVEDYLAIAYAREIDNRTTYWCPEWWRHPEALARLDALWRAWEHLRRDPALGPSTWWRDHADHHMPLLLSQEGPFRRCGPDRGHTSRVVDRLHTTAPEDNFWGSDLT